MPRELTVQPRCHEQSHCVLENSLQLQRIPPASENSLQRPHSMILAVGHIQHTLVREHAVRSSQLAPHGIAVGAVPTLSGAQDRVEYSRM